MSTHTTTTYDELPPIARAATRGDWLAMVAGWMLFAGVGIVPTVQILQQAGVVVTWWQVALSDFVDVLMWIAAARWIFEALDRLPLTRGQPWTIRVRNLVFRGALGFAAACIHAFFSRGAVFILGPLAGAHPSVYSTPLLSYSASVSASFDGFVAVLLAHAIVQRVHRSRRRHRMAAEFESTLAKARLHALSKELEPHFLFNTLNGIAALVREDAELAEAMLIRLSDMLRLTLESGSDGELTLREELARLDLYLDLQQMRFGPRLAVRRTLDPSALDALVPSMLLQPLVENALSHGIGPTPGPGTVEIDARRIGDQLRLTISDTGPGFPRDVAARESTGIRNTRERLAAVYGARFAFVLGSAHDRARGARVSIEIPYRAAPLALESGAA